MLKSEYLACMKLHYKLKDKINGYMFIQIDDNDTLYINVRSFRGTRFKYKIDNISKEIKGTNFININKIISMFLKDYKDYINKLYFNFQKWEFEDIFY